MPGQSETGTAGTTAAIGYRLRAEARSRWRAWLGLAIVIGLMGGVAVAAGAGARRTETAYPRLLSHVDQEDALYAPANAERAFDDRKNPIVEDADHFPSVERTGRLGQLATAYGTDIRRVGQDIGAFAMIGGSGYSISRPLIVAGRMPNPRRVREALVDTRFAAKHHLEVGSRFPVVGGSMRAFDAAMESGRAYDGPVHHETLTVAGIGRFARNVIPTTENDEQPILYVTPAFFAKHPDTLINFGGVARLKPGASIESFRRDLYRSAARHGVPSQAVYVTFERNRTETVARAVRPQVLALWLVAVLVGLATLLVVGQALARQVFIDNREASALGAIGLTHRQQFALAATRVMMVTAVGASLAVRTAIALSPLFPIGIARDAEPTPGLAVDGVSILVGMACLVVGFLLIGAVAAWRATRATVLGVEASDARQTHPSRVAAALSRMGTGPGPVIGIRMAFEPGRGRTAVPVRSALVTTAAAIAAVAAVFTFAGNMDRLVTTPARYGWDWTAVVGFGFDPTPPAARDVLLNDPKVAAVAGGNYLDLTIGHRTVTAVTFDPIKGHIGPVILEGRRPRGKGEVVLGTRTMADAGVHIGDRIPVTVEEHRGTLRVVGRAVFPRLGAGSFTPTDLSDGAALTNAAVHHLGVQTVDPESGSSPFALYFVRAAPGVSDAQLARSLNRRLTGILDECPSAECVRRVQAPGDVTAYRRVQGTSRVLVALLAFMALGAVLHALLSAARRRRRDFAILKTLGFGSRDVGRTVRWQGLASACAALVIGIPVGVIAGKALWSLFADQIGVATDPIVIVVPMLVAVPVTLAVTAIVATIPARLARRVRPSTVLHSA